MEGSVTDLSRYRLEKAKEDLETAEENLNTGKYRASVNRSYYAVFHALRAITALDQFDSGKHSGIISFFNQHYVKTGVFSRDISKKSTPVTGCGKRQITTISFLSPKKMLSSSLKKPNTLSLPSSNIFQRNRMSEQ